ncbi:MAG TPA: SAM-dependent methyltransferase [Acidimicrobiales bacterium]|nr:SAM-dependent methyltransferase [Acidimicrobiales bacterium]
MGTAGSPLAARVVERIHRLGPLSFSGLIELALYEPELGFYETAEGAGRRGGDFLTSPEVGALFGAVLARALDAWWEGLGRPDPYVVVEAGAGRGALARDVLAADPACAPALRYVLVERSERQRARQAELLPLELPSLVLGPVEPGEGTDDDAGPRLAKAKGPLLTALAGLPAEPIVSVVLANELLDNIAFDLLERGDTGWYEVRVGEHLGELTEVPVPARDDMAEQADRLVADPPSGGRIPVESGARSWLRDALELVPRGRVVAVDYLDTTPSLARRPWTDWVRTYRGHGRGSHPLEHLGEQDVTCEVAWDQLAQTRSPTLVRSQADFLDAHGLTELVEEARQRWREGASRPDLGALAARSRVTEAKGLVDPAGLGAFGVLEWEVG